MTKHVKYCSIIQARFSKKFYLQPSQPTMPGMPTLFGVEHAIIKQFCHHQEKKTGNLFKDLSENLRTCQRIFYIKKQKLAAVSYSTTT